MAEIIRIASLEIDTDKIIKESVRLKKELDTLKASQKELKESGEESSEAFIKNEIAIKQLSKAYRDNQSFAKAVDSANKNLDETLSTQNKSTQQLRDSRSELNQISKNIVGNSKEEIDLRNRLNKVIDEQTKELRDQSSEFNSSKDQIGEYRQNILAAVEELRKQEQVLIDTRKELEANQKELKEGTEEYQNYSLAIANVDKDLEKVNESLEVNNEEVQAADFSIQGFIDSSKEAGGASAFMSGNIKGATKSTKGLIKSTLRFLVTPLGIFLGAIAAAYALITNAMSRNEETTTKVKKAFAGLTGIFRAFLKILQPIGEFLVEGLVKGMELAEKAITKSMRGIQKALDFLGFDNSAAGLEKFNDTLEATVQASKDLTTAELARDKAQREARKTQLLYQKDAEKLRQLRDDTSKADLKGIGLRIEANDRLGALLKKQGEEELKLAQKTLEVANLRIKVEGETKDALDARAEAETEIIDIQERLTGQTSEQLVNRVALQKEATDFVKKQQEDLAKAEAQTDKEREEARKKHLKAKLDLEKKHAAARLKLEKEVEAAIKADEELELRDEEEQNEKELQRMFAQSQARLDLVQEEADKRLEIELARLAQEKEAEEQAQEAKKAVINELFSFSNTIGNRRIANLQKQVKEGTKTEEEGAREIAKIQRRQAVVQKAQALFNVAINTFDAITKAGAQLGAFAVPAQIALGALGVFQAANIAAEPLPDIPEFALGGIGGVVKGPSHKNGGVNVRMRRGGELNVEGGEAWINREATARNLPLLSAINESTGGRPLMATGGIGGSTSAIANSIIDYDLLASKLANANRALPSPVVSVEEINTVSNNVSVIESIASS